MQSVPFAGGYRTIMVDAILIVVNVDAILIVVNPICRCRRYSTAGNCCYVTQKWQ